MTDIVNPSDSRPADALLTAGALANAGSSDGFVFDGAAPTLHATDANIDETAFNTFDQTSSSTSFDVTIAPGEAIAYGSWLARDTNTTVTLAASTTGQTVYAGWSGDPDDLIIGLDAAFASDDPQLPLWTFDTDGSGVTAVSDERRVGYSQDIVGKEFFGDEDFSISYDSGSDELEIRDEVNDTLKMSFDKSGDVEIPNGTLDLDENGIKGVSDFRGSGKSSFTIRANETTTQSTEQIIDFKTINSGANNWITGLQILPNGAASHVLVPNGFLAVSTPSSPTLILNDESTNGAFPQIEYRHRNSKEFSVEYDIDSESLTLKDYINSTDVLNAHAGGNVSIPNGNLSVSSSSNTTLTLDESGEASNSELRYSHNDTDEWRIMSKLGNYLSIDNYDSINTGEWGTALNIDYTSANVSIPNGSLDVTAEKDGSFATTISNTASGSGVSAKGLDVSVPNEGGADDVVFQASSAGDTVFQVKGETVSIPNVTTKTEEIENKDYTEQVETHASVSGTITIDLSVANIHRVAATGDVTIQFNNVSSTPAGNSVVILFGDSDGTGPHSISWPTGTVWSNGNTVAEVAANSDIEVSMLTYNGGAVWRGRISGEAFA